MLSDRSKVQLFDFTRPIILVLNNLDAFCSLVAYSYLLPGGSPIP